MYQCMGTGVWIGAINSIGLHGWTVKQFHLPESEPDCPIIAGVPDSLIWPGFFLKYAVVIVSHLQV